MFVFTRNPDEAKKNLKTNLLEKKLYKSVINLNMEFGS